MNEPKRLINKASATLTQIKATEAPRKSRGAFALDAYQSTAFIGAADYPI
jgi:hypothetical protein